MTIRDLVRGYLLADGVIDGYLNGRIKSELGEKADYPAARIQAIDITRPNTLRGVATLARARIQLDVFCNASAAAASGFASSRSAVDTIGAAIRRRLDGFVGQFSDTTSSPATPVQAAVTFDLETEGVEQDIHGGLSRHTADYMVQYTTNGGAY